MKFLSLTYPTIAFAQMLVEQTGELSLLHKLGAFLVFHIIVRQIADYCAHDTGILLVNMGFIVQRQC